MPAASRYCAIVIQVETSRHWTEHLGCNPIILPSLYQLRIAFDSTRKNTRSRLRSRWLDFDRPGVVGYEFLYVPIWFWICAVLINTFEVIYDAM